MANSVTLPGVDGHSTWTCRSQERQLSDVLLSVHIDNSTKDLSLIETDAYSECTLVLLEQTEDGSPCVLTLSCGPQPPALITKLLITSEARTMEVYAQTGDYCGTCRGERDQTVQPDGEGRGPFYRKQLLLDCPSASCQVKLLSLGGRSSVLVSRIILGLQIQERPTDKSSSGPWLGPSIDMQRVQSLVDEMGSSLSPGAQSLMDMVHFQQKNQANALSSFLPALMGARGLSVLSRGAAGPPASNGAQPAGSMSPASTPRPPEPAPPAQNGVLLSDECDSAAPSPGSDPSLPGHGVKNRTLSHSRNPGPVSHAQLAEMMSHFLNGQVPGRGSGQDLSSSPDLLPMLQSVCGQVTQLRLDNAAAEEAERRTAGGTRELDPAMEQRLEEMERRLKEHMDRRLDALEQKLEKALLSALPLITLHQGTPAAAGPSPDQILHSAQTQTQALH